MLGRETLAAALLAVLAAPAAWATEIEVSFSEAFQEKLEEDYGTREGDYLREDVTEDLERALGKRGVEAARIAVVIEDAKPNRPTFKQLGDQPGLDAIRSISIGGAAFKGTAFDAAGETLADVSYDWYERDIRQVRGSATWQDANRASRRFASKMAEALETPSDDPAGS